MSAVRFRPPAPFSYIVPLKKRKKLSRTFLALISFVVAVQFSYLLVIGSVTGTFFPLCLIVFVLLLFFLFVLPVRTFLTGLLIFEFLFGVGFRFAVFLNRQTTYSHVNLYMESYQLAHAIRTYSLKDHPDIIQALRMIKMYESRYPERLIEYTTAKAQLLRNIFESNLPRTPQLIEWLNQEIHETDAFGFHKALQKSYDEAVSGCSDKVPFFEIPFQLSTCRHEVSDFDWVRRQARLTHKRFKSEWTPHFYTKISNMLYLHEHWNRLTSEILLRHALMYTRNLVRLYTWRRIVYLTYVNPRVVFKNPFPNSPALRVVHGCWLQPYKGLVVNRCQRRTYSFDDLSVYLFE